MSGNHLMFGGIFLLWIFQLISGQLLTMQNLPQWRSVPYPTIDLGDPLVLTELIEDGNEDEARRLARVNESQFLGVVSYSGFLTVNDDYDSNLFFWFFPAEGTEKLYDDDLEESDDDDGSYSGIHDNDDDDTRKKMPPLKYGSKKARNNTQKYAHKLKKEFKRPVVLWLQGGPGSSSLFGLFTENGPFFVNDDKKTLRKNPYSWHTKYNLIFIDNPVGAGFSYTDPDGYCRTIKCTADHMYNGLIQFFELFPWLQQMDFFITGESFAGKYLPGKHLFFIDTRQSIKSSNPLIQERFCALSAIGNAIWDGNKEEDFIINLQGLALGNALSDPVNMLEYADFAYQTGLVDIHGKNAMRLFELLAKEYYPSFESKIYWDTMLYAFLQSSNYSNLYNILQPEELDLESYRNFVEQIHIRKAIHAGEASFHSPEFVYINLIPDFMTTAMHWTEKLLNEGLRIMYYSGNMDFIIAYPLSENAYQHMKWKGSEKYRAARRESLIVNSKMAGYVKKADNFIDATVLNAGHMVPTDQPEVALELIDRFIHNTL